MDIWELRREVYWNVASRGRAPTRLDIERLVGRVHEAETLLTEMHERHLLVLDARGEVQMALPFAAGDTGHRVVGSGTTWFANCAWDALAIPIAVGADATIEADWLDEERPVELSVSNGELSSYAGFVHFAVPAARWWDDIVET